MGETSIAAGASVLKFEKGECSLPAEDRTAAQESWLCQGPEREAFRLGEDPLAQGIDRHLRLFLCLPQPDVEVPALDLFLPHHDDVGNPFLLRRPDFFDSVSSESSRSARTSGRRSSRPRANSSWSTLTGTIRTCVGDNQTGSMGVLPSFAAAAAFSRNA